MNFYDEIAENVIESAKELKKLGQQRDDLLEALKGLCNKYLQNLGTPNEFVSCIMPEGIPDYWRRALAAIAKATRKA